MKTKNIKMKTKILTITLVLTVLLGCEETHTYPDEIVFDSDVSSEQVNIEESAVFTDYSTGVVSRLWTFPGGIPSTSSEQEVEVSFSDLGFVTCTIENTFSDGITETKEILVEVITDVVVIGDQTYVYNETISSGLFLADGSELANPNPDSVNNSENCVVSGPSNWSQIQYFPNYIPESCDKIFFSIYNPDNVGPGQIQFEYTSDPGVWQWGGNLEYNIDAVTGWVEYSLDMSSHLDNEINKIIFMPAGSSSSIIYADNIYFGKESVIPSPEPSLAVYDEEIASSIFFGDGSEVANPNSDCINNSEKCAASGPSTWSQIQFFPIYTPVNEDKIFFSINNPDNVGPGQIQFEYTSDPGVWQWGGNLEYDVDALTSWVEYSLDMSSHVGNEINKIIFIPAGNSSSIVYVDNIYFGPLSVLP
jgi:hypothetical protein